MRRVSLCLVAILAFVPLASATAQVPVRPGERVRVTRLPICPPTHATCVGNLPRQNVGTFVTWSADTLLAQSNGNTLAVPLDSVTKIEVGRGQKAYPVAGVVIGFLVGGAAGAAILQNKPAFRGRRWTDGEGFLVGALVGGVVGGLIGRSIKTDRWEEVALDRVRVSLGPQRDGRLGLGLSVRF